MNNTTADTTLNNTTGYWKPFEPDSMPDFGLAVSNSADGVRGLLESWGFDAFDFIFTAFLGVVTVTLIYYFFVRVTSSSSWIFRPIGYILIIFILMIMLGLI